MEGKNLDNFFKNKLDQLDEADFEPKAVSWDQVEQVLIAENILPPTFATWVWLRSNLSALLIGGLVVSNLVLFYQLFSTEKIVRQLTEEVVELKKVVVSEKEKTKDFKDLTTNDVSVPTTVLPIAADDFGSKENMNSTILDTISTIERPVQNPKFKTSNNILEGANKQQRTQFPKVGNYSIKEKEIIKAEGDAIPPQAVLKNNGIPKLPSVKSSTSMKITNWQTPIPAKEPNLSLPKTTPPLPTLQTVEMLASRSFELEQQQDTLVQVSLPFTKKKRISFMDRLRLVIADNPLTGYQINGVYGQSRNDKRFDLHSFNEIMGIRGGFSIGDWLQLGIGVNLFESHYNAFLLPSDPIPHAIRIEPNHPNDILEQVRGEVEIMEIPISARVAMYQWNKGGVYLGLGASAKYYAQHEFHYVFRGFQSPHRPYPKKEKESLEDWTLGSVNSFIGIEQTILKKCGLFAELDYQYDFKPQGILGEDDGFLGFRVGFFVKLNR